MNLNLAIILVEPENPANIGSAARAMKNMGHSDLRLVKPPKDWKAKGLAMAMSARDVLEGASVFSEVKDAVEDTYLVIGTSRRQGPKRGQFLPFDEAIQKIHRVAAKRKTAILFGKESKGLDNESLGFCDHVLSIPANPVYPSLNLAQAVLLIGFALFQKKRKKQEIKTRELRFVEQKDIHEILEKIKKALQILGYREEGYDVVDRIVATFHGLFKRNGLIESEAQMFRGLTRRISERTPEK